MDNLILVAIVMVLLSILLVMYQKYWNRAVRCQSDERVDEKIIVITGGTGCLGKAIGVQLATRGGRIVLACRNKVEADKAAEDIKELTGNQDVTVMYLDVSLMSSVRNFVQQFQDTYSHIDILIHAAGVCGVPYARTVEGLETTMATNHIGPFLLSNLLLDHFSLGGRIIMLSGHAHIFANLQPDQLMMTRIKHTYSWWTAYCDSKLANILTVAELARKLPADSNISVFAVNPGLVYSGLYKHFCLVKWFPAVAEWFGANFMKTVDEGIQTPLYCAVSSEAEKYSGRYLSNCALSTPIVSGLSEHLGHRLWVVSCRLVKIDHVRLRMPYGPEELEELDRIDHDDDDGGDESNEVTDEEEARENVESIVEQLEFVGLDELQYM